VVARFEERDLPRGARAMGRFRASRSSIRSPPPAGWRRRSGGLGLLGQLFARRQVARVQPPSSTWSRQHYRGSYAADLWIANLADNTYTKLLGDEQYKPVLADVGADGSIYFVADPLPNDKSVKPGSPEVRRARTTSTRFLRPAPASRFR